MNWRLVAAVFVVVIGLQLWLVAAAGTDIPFYDQWGIEGSWLFPSWVDGSLRAVDLVQPLNEHRMVWTHLLNLGLFMANGQWDPLVELGAINGAFMLGRRAVLEAVGQFDEDFFMYGDDLDLCIRVTRAGFQVVYDGRFRLTHLKGQSVAKEYGTMAHAIFDANREVYLKHFNPRDSTLIRWKYTVAFGLWKKVALGRARLRGHRRVRPL